MNFSFDGWSVTTWRVEDGQQVWRARRGRRTAEFFAPRDAPVEDLIHKGLVALGEREPCCAAEVYYCPVSRDIECPQHGGFDVCCDQPERHVPIANLEARMRLGPPSGRRSLAPWERQELREIAENRISRPATKRVGELIFKALDALEGSDPKE